MRSRVPLIVAAALSLCTRSAVQGQTHRALPNAPRTIAVSEAEAPPLIRAGLLQSTLIILPSEEKVANVFAGDTVDWVFDGGHMASRFISVKPKLAKAETDIHIVSDHGNEYTLELRETSADEDAHFDSKIFLVPGDEDGKRRLTEMPVFVPATELDNARQEAAAAKDKQASAVNAEQVRAEEERSRYPGRLHFDYSWDQGKGRALGLEQIWRDDKFTYLRGQFQETPALYEIKDGKGSLINYDFASGLYTVPKQIETGYLAIGKQKVEFRRVPERN